MFNKNVLIGGCALAIFSYGDLAYGGGAINFPTKMREQVVEACITAIQNVGLDLLVPKTEAGSVIVGGEGVLETPSFINSTEAIGLTKAKKELGGSVVERLEHIMHNQDAMAKQITKLHYTMCLQSLHFQQSMRVLTRHNRTLMKKTELLEKGQTTIFAYLQGVLDDESLNGYVDHFYQARAEIPLEKDTNLGAIGSADRLAQLEKMIKEIEDTLASIGHQNCPWHPLPPEEDPTVPGEEDNPGNIVDPEDNTEIPGDEMGEEGI